MALTSWTRRGRQPPTYTPPPAPRATAPARRAGQSHGGKRQTARAAGRPKAREMEGETRQAVRTRRATSCGSRPDWIFARTSCSSGRITNDWRSSSDMVGQTILTFLMRIFLRRRVPPVCSCRLVVGLTNPPVDARLCPKLGAEKVPTKNVSARARTNQPTSKQTNRQANK